MTDLERVREAVQPLIDALVPFFFRAKVRAAITHENVKRIYEAAGGAEGVDALAAAIKRIGTGETVGAP